MDLFEFLKGDLIIVAVICYLIGNALKNTIKVKDKFIPLVLGAVGVVVTAMWVFATSFPVTPQDWFSAVFTAITQGILAAGLSNYANQMIKQLKKTEE